MLREEPRLAFPLPLFPHTGGKKCSPTRQGKAARIKKPQPGTVGVSPYKLPSLSLERTSQRSVGQVSWLAAAIYSLHLPKAMRLSGLCRFRSAYSCGAAMDLHHLPWSRPETVTSPTSGVFDSRGELTADRPALSRTFLQGSPSRKEGWPYGSGKGSSVCASSPNRRPCIRRNSASSPCASALVQLTFGAVPAPRGCNLYPSSDTALANSVCAAVCDPRTSSRSSTRTMASACMACASCRFACVCPSTRQTFQRASSTASSSACAHSAWRVSDGLAAGTPSLASGSHSCIVIPCLSTPLKEATWGRREAAHIKKPQLDQLGSAHTSCRPFPSKGRLSAMQGRSPGSRHSLLSAPSQGRSTSVVSADFDPLTVAGQRWIHTIFPGHDHRSDHHPADDV